MKKLMMAAALVAGSVSLTAQADSVSQKNLSWRRPMRWQTLPFRRVWRRTIRFR